ncbi:MAG: glycosyltransferase family 4 protein [Maritimibacter sp.]
MGRDISEFSDPTARLLDLSRLVSRVGRGAFTGVDRVEAAYLRHFLSDAKPVFAIVRSGFGFTLFDRAGTQALADRLFGVVSWGSADLLSRLFVKSSPLRQRVETDLRRIAIGRAGRATLRFMLRRHLPEGSAWINVGHSNLKLAMFDAIHALDGGQAVVLIHDTIPLDFPAFQREGTVEQFRVRMEQVARKADLVVYNSRATQDQARSHFERFGRVPPGLVAHLGIETPEPIAANNPDGLRLDRPYFVILGTIEPRKNHAFLLDLWQQLASRYSSDDMPNLFIVGARGWANEAVFARLDHLGPLSTSVHELGTLPDGAAHALIQGAVALLMPSFAEGFGLPPGEALALGTPVIAANLPVYWEVFGNNLVYPPKDDLLSWAKAVDMVLEERPSITNDSISLPTWNDHFNLILKVV